MNTVYYPAVFHEEEKGYWVEFPDLPGCFTQGDSEQEALSMAKDALGLYLDENLDNIHKASSCKQIQASYPNELVMLVDCNPDLYSRKLHSKAVKKTLTIPEWLNDKATAAGANFSEILKDALIKKYNL